MRLCKVIGNVQSTVKHPVYHGHKVMIVQPLDENLAPRGDSFLAVDFAQAGPGDVVLVAVEGNAARQLFGDDQAPVHSVIEGVVDHVDIGDAK
ncbi:MAG: EutN/CcmL family microcompartment protein [Nitrospinae bacterium]|nr:EutN/CcmL family microcompartment protein [Nitrospinota bacterium]